MCDNKTIVGLFTGMQRDLDPALIRGGMNQFFNRWDFPSLCIPCPLELHPNVIFSASVSLDHARQQSDPDT